MQTKPYIITICSEKGGVGKTTLATNLAIFLKALHEDLPVTILSFDNHYSVDLLFTIGKQKKSRSVIDLFGDATVNTLPETGEYGVNYIQSSQQLQTIQSSIDSPFILENRLHTSGIPGIIIIDTKPTLDIFTHNALVAADRVLIPVKDLPSLENCKNIYGFFREHQISRKHLRVIPSLVEGRIKYKGAFKNQAELLRAFALNRGYRCLAGHISKSPKVDALNTNPEGKIYPILTHGKSSETYNQYVQLSSEVFQDYIDTVKKWEKELTEEIETKIVRIDEGSNAETDKIEANSVVKDPEFCLICNTELNDQSRHYVESSSGMKGYIEASCFSRHLLKAYADSNQAEWVPNDLHLIRIQKKPPFSTLFACDSTGTVKKSIDLPTASMHDKNLTTFLRPFVIEHASDEPFFLTLEELKKSDKGTTPDESTQRDQWKNNAINLLKTA